LLSAQKTQFMKLRTFNLRWLGAALCCRHGPDGPHVIISSHYNVAHVHCNVYLAQAFIGVSRRDSNCVILSELTAQLYKVSTATVPSAAAHMLSL
jgi:hypothetical protein